MRKAILGLTCFVALQLISLVAHAQSAVKIGLIMTYTGQFTDAAAQMDNGIKLYMKQHGDTVGGKKIELIRKDTAGAPDAAKRLAQDLIVNDNVDILGGFVITPEALAVAELSAQAKKFMVVMNAATSIITTKSPYIVRSSLTLPQNCEVLGTWAFQNGAKKVFTMVSDYAPGLDAESSFQRAYAAAGGQIIGSVRVPLANPDFSAFVQRAKDSGADSIFVFVPGGAQPAALAKALVERGMDPSKIKIMGQGDLVVMIEVAAFITTINFFACADSSATAKASGVITNPPRMSTLSLTIKSCAKRLAASGAPAVSLRISSIFLPPTVSPCCFMYSLMPLSICAAASVNWPV